MYGCPACNEKETVALKPNLGADRNIAIESVHAARVREKDSSILHNAQALEGDCSTLYLR